MATEIIKNHDIVFSNRPRTRAANMLFRGCSDVGFAFYGEYWRQVRKICVHELFSNQRVHSFQFVREEEVEVLISKMLSSSLKEESINLTEMLLLMSFCVGDMFPYLSSVDFKGQDFHFIPFGIGRRGCPGMPFGVASVEYVVANLLYWFDWKLPAGENVENLDMTELYRLTVSKKVPLHVIPLSHFSV
ncbi:hypothetical protein PTKIN_Ptkin04bG0041900 [Pterospermum kingtungense]